MSQQYFSPDRRAGTRAAGQAIVSPKSPTNGNAREQWQQQSQSQQQWDSPNTARYNQQQQQQAQSQQPQSSSFDTDYPYGNDEKDSSIAADAAEQQAVNEALAAHRCICDICKCGKHHWSVQTPTQSQLSSRCSSIAPPMSAINACCSHLTPMNELLCAHDQSLRDPPAGAL